MDETLRALERAARQAGREPLTDPRYRLAAERSTGDPDPVQGLSGALMALVVKRLRVMSPMACPCGALGAFVRTGRVTVAGGVKWTVVRCWGGSSPLRAGVPDAIGTIEGMPSMRGYADRFIQACIVLLGHDSERPWETPWDRVKANELRHLLTPPPPFPPTSAEIAARRARMEVALAMSGRIALDMDALIVSGGLLDAEQRASFVRALQAPSPFADPPDPPPITVVDRFELRSVSIIPREQDPRA